MTKTLKIIGKLTAGLLVIVFIMMAVTSMLFLSLERQLLNPDFYLDVLEKQKAYDQLPVIAAEQLRYAMGNDPRAGDPENSSEEEVASATTGSTSNYFQALSQSDWELLLTGLLAPDFLEAQVQSMIADLFEYFDTGEGELSISISMLELKEHLSGEAGVNAIVGLLDTQPDCSNADLIAMSRVLQGAGEPGQDFLTCRPPAAFIEDYTPQLEVLFRRSLRDVPDKIVLAEGLFVNDESGSGTIPFAGQQLTPYLLLKWIRWGIQMSPLAALTVLLFIALLAVDSFKALRGWWGSPLLISGLIGITIAFLAPSLARWGTDTFIAGKTAPGISPHVVETGINLAVQMIQSLFVQVRNFALITIGLGLVAIIVPSIVNIHRSSDTVDMESPDV